MNKNNDITELVGIQGWKVVGFEINEKENRLIMQIERCDNTFYKCAQCGESYLFAYDFFPERIIEDIPAWGRRTFIRYRQARVKCTKCGKVCMEKLSFVEPYQHQSMRYQRFLASLCDYMPVADVSDFSGLDKDTLYRIDKRYLEERRKCFSHENEVLFLGIDEIALKKGHKYAAVFYDLERGEVIGLVKGRKQRNVSGFFRRWGKDKCRKVIAACTDLWAAYHNSVKIHLKQADLVFDKFHVFKYLSDTVDDVRRTEQNKVEKEGKQLIKGCRWIMLKKDLTRNQKRKLTEIMEQNQTIAKAMLLKDGFTAFYEAETAEKAEAILDEWTEQCKESGIPQFKKLAKRLNRWKSGILAFFKHRITNAVAEGINNKIKVIKRRSYGFHDMDYFFNKILQATGLIPHMKVAYP